MKRSINPLKTVFLTGLLCLPLLKTFVQAQQCVEPVILVDSFSTRQANKDTRKLEFIPMYRGRACTEEQLRIHMFEWQFSEHDFSHAARPRRVLDPSKPMEVVLRVETIKEQDDPDCSNPGDADTIRYEAAPSARIIQEIRQVIQGIRPKGLGPLVTNLPVSDTTPWLRLGQPTQAPQAGVRFSLAAELYNPSTCEMRLSGSLQAHTKTGYISVRQASIMVPTSDESTWVPDAQLELVIAPGQLISLPFQVRVPEDVFVGDSICVEFLAAFRPTKSKSCKDELHIQGDQYVTVETIDPNTLTLTRNNYKPGEAVSFRLHVTNEGNAPETEIYLRDSLHKDFDPKSFAVQEILIHDHRLSPVERPSAATPGYRVDFLTGGLAQVRVHLAENDALQPDDSIVFVFSAKLDGRFKEMQARQARSYRIPKRVQTMFSKEGVWYQVQCTPSPVVLIPAHQPMYVPYIIGAGIIVALVGFELVRRLRKNYLEKQH